MSISSATLLVFIFILPGFVFLIGLRSKSRLSIPGLRNNLIWDVSFLLVISFFINIACLEIYFDTLLLPYLSFTFDPNSLTFHGPQDITLTYTQFAYQHKEFVFIYLLINIIVAYLLGRIVIIANNFRFFPFRSDFHYGTFYNIVSGRFTFINTSIMTKVAHNGKVLMYSGYLSDIVFSHEMTIDYILLEYPIIRSFLDLNQTPPATTDGTYLELPTPDSTSGSFLVNGSDIENIFFTRLQPSDPLAALRASLFQIKAVFTLQRPRIWVLIAVFILLVVAAMMLAGRVL